MGGGVAERAAAGVRAADGLLLHRHRRHRRAGAWTYFCEYFDGDVARVKEVKNKYIFKSLPLHFSEALSGYWDTYNSSYPF